MADETLGTTPDERLVIVADQAEQAVARQEVRLNDRRTAAGTLFSAGAIAAGFLGAESFSATNGPGAWAWVGAIFFALSGIVLAFVMWPRNWMFTMDVRSLLERIDAEDMSLNDVNHERATWFSRSYEHNDQRLDGQGRAMPLMAVLLVGEIAAFFVNLALA